MWKTYKMQIHKTSMQKKIVTRQNGTQMQTIIFCYKKPEYQL